MKSELLKKYQELVIKKYGYRREVLQRKCKLEGEEEEIFTVKLRKVFKEIEDLEKEEYDIVRTIFQNELRGLQNTPGEHDVAIGINLDECGGHIEIYGLIKKENEEYGEGHWNMKSEKTLYVTNDHNKEVQPYEVCDTSMYIGYGWERLRLLKEIEHEDIKVGKYSDVYETERIVVEGRCNCIREDIFEKYCPLNTFNNTVSVTVSCRHEDAESILELCLEFVLWLYRGEKRESLLNTIRKWVKQEIDWVRENIDYNKV